MNIQGMVILLALAFEEKKLRTKENKRNRYSTSNSDWAWVKMSVVAMARCTKRICDREKRKDWDWTSCLRVHVLKLEEAKGLAFSRFSRV